MELAFKEGDYLVKTLHSQDEMEAAFRLRHEVFCEELKWVPPSAGGLERDAYDEFAQSFGVIAPDKRLIAHVRLIKAPYPFMIEKEFACLLPKDKLYKKLPGTVEATRICTEKEYRNVHFPPDVTLAHLIYKIMYHWSIMNGMSHYITITEKRYYILLKRGGFDLQPLGEFLPMGEGVMSGVITLNWHEAASILKQKKPLVARWLLNLKPLVQEQPLRRASY